MIFHSHGEFTMSGKRGKSRQGLNTKQKRGHMEGVVKENKVTWMECKMHVA